MKSKQRICAVYLFDGYADHEIALTLSWLNTASDFVIHTFTKDGRSVTSMSGCQVTPSWTLAKTDPEYFDLLVLPGGVQWEKADNLEIFPLIRKTFGKRPIAAICGATLALADLGLLNDIPHTSNFPGYLQQYCPDYQGEQYYRWEPCVNAGEIITAHGAAAIDFAFEILRTFGVFNHQKSLEWRALYQSGGKVATFFTDSEDLGLEEKPTLQEI